MGESATRYLCLVHEGRNEWWRYGLSLVIIMACWLVLGYLPYYWLAANDAITRLTLYIAVNFSIFMMLAGLALAMRFVHRRPLMTLVGAGRRFDVKRILQAAAVWGAIGLAAAGIEHLLYPERYYLSFDPGPFFVFAAVALVLTPIQTTTEELIFRGYAMQALSLVMRRPLAIAVVSAFIFTLPHLMNPEVHRAGLAVAASYYAIGLLLAVITLRDGRLDLAIGAHAANNLGLALIANYEGSALTGESIFTARELDPGYTFVSIVAGSVLFYALFFGRRRVPASAT